MTNNLSQPIIRLWAFRYLMQKTNNGMSYSAFHQELCDVCPYHFRLMSDIKKLRVNVSTTDHCGCYFFNFSLSNCFHVLQEFWYWEKIFILFRLISSLISRIW